MSPPCASAAADPNHVDAPLNGHDAVATTPALVARSAQDHSRDARLRLPRLTAADEQAQATTVPGLIALTANEIRHLFTRLHHAATLETSGTGHTGDAATQAQAPDRQQPHSPDDELLLEYWP